MATQHRQPVLPLAFGAGFPCRVSGVNPAVIADPGTETPAADRELALTRGRFVVATEPIPAGGAVLIALPYALAVEDSQRKRVCAWCTMWAGDLPPPSACRYEVAEAILGVMAASAAASEMSPPGVQPPMPPAGPARTLPFSCRGCDQYYFCSILCQRAFTEGLVHDEMACRAHRTLSSRIKSPSVAVVMRLIFDLVRLGNSGPCSRYSRLGSAGQLEERLRGIRLVEDTRCLSLVLPCFDDVQGLQSHANDMEAAEVNDWSSDLKRLHAVFRESGIDLGILRRETCLSSGSSECRSPVRKNPHPRKAHRGGKKSANITNDHSPPIPEHSPPVAVPACSASPRQHDPLLTLLSRLESNVFGLFHSPWLPEPPSSSMSPETPKPQPTRGSMGKPQKKPSSAKYGRGVVETQPFGRAIIPEASYFNHSCNPNAEFHWTWLQPPGQDPAAGEGDSAVCPVMVFRAVRPIAVGEEVTISYVPTNRPVSTRRHQLREGYFFNCGCDRCCQEAGPR
ncbi:hypothetical protein H696_03132 [Fonticula alba]|uniref:SET domain-containing protein n=1 Tax=Fonticula alba TaxID=691883 RepID=A0A058ZBH9_FONAL|nr:hypothetical protein H696_03132 [Fonticula alba]KCV70782.1 hypothetical protein H696_03132 [Fonticula alba]|eukprot:XP_009495298.1 hypothetical protein H696_03132 [Fonticula alba]